MEAGGDGIVEADRLDLGTANVRFRPVNCSRCSLKEFTSARVIYEVQWAEDEELLNVLGKCGAQAFYENDVASNDNLINKVRLHPDNVKSKVFNLNLNDTTDEFINTDILLINNSATYYVSVKATIKSFPKSSNDIEIFYENTVIQVPDGLFYSRHHPYFWGFVVVVQLIFIIICVGLCMICRKYK